MEGLEISVLNLSDVLIENEEFRFDSEYFKKHYLVFDEFIKRKVSNKVGGFAKVSDGDHSKFPENQKDEVRYLQAKDIKNHFILDHNPTYVSKSYFDKNKRSHITEENVIMSIMGSVGDIAITPKGFKATLANRAIAIIKNITDVNPYYLFTYLSCKYGQLQINRQKNGGVQQRINLDVLSKVKIPYVHSDFENQIEVIIKLSHKIKFKSLDVYKLAEIKLLHELGLKDFEESKEAVNIKTFSDSFGVSGRLDAEYYHKKYENLEKQIRKSIGKVLLINDVLLKPIKNGTTPDEVYKECGTINFIRVEAFGDNLDFNDSDCNSISENTFEKHKNNRVVKDDILVSMTGTIGNVSIYNSNQKGVINQNLVKLTIRKELVFVNYLAIYIKTVGAIFLTKLQTGNVQPYVNISNFSELIVPIIAFDKQKQIAELVEESFKLKKQSEHLLEVAKTAVEVAIEQNEQKAMEYINLNTTE